jgi:hypothetical protein
MDEQLKQGYIRLIMAHRAAVVCDTEYGLSDSDKLHGKSKKLWEDFHKIEQEFKELLEKVKL